LNFEGAWNKPTLCTFRGISARGNSKVLTNIGDVGRAHLGGDRMDDRTL
jgi:hypothetical protein